MLLQVMVMVMGPPSEALAWLVVRGTAAPLVLVLGMVKGMAAPLVLVLGTVKGMVLAGGMGMTWLGAMVMVMAIVVLVTSLAVEMVRVRVVAVVVGWAMPWRSVLVKP